MVMSSSHFTDEVTGTDKLKMQNQGLNRTILLLPEHRAAGTLSEHRPHCCVLTMRSR